MELITLLITGFLGLLAPVGLITEEILASRLREELVAVETLEVRIDNRPNYQLARGTIDRLRIATRGVYPLEQVRIAILEIETDRIEEFGEQPIQGAVRIVLTETDLNRALTDQFLKDQLNQLLPKSRSREFQILNSHLDLLPDNRLHLNLELETTSLESRESQILEIELELGLKIVQGKGIEIIEPAATVDDREVSDKLIQGFAEGISQRINLTELESRGLITRILGLDITDQEISLAAFVRIEKLSELSVE